MIRKIILALFCVCLAACNQERNGTDKFQVVRNNEINVQSCVKEIRLDETQILIGGSSHIYAMGRYLLIQDMKSYDRLVSIFDKGTFRYLGSTGVFGEGPNEITNQGRLCVNEREGEFYITDHAKMKVFRFKMDSVLFSPFDYVPNVKTIINPENFLSEYDYINDTLCIGRAIVPVGTNDYRPSLAKWNMLTGEITSFSGDAPSIKHKRIVTASSSDYRLALEVHEYNDLISVFDFNGNLKCNIYGPEWSDKLLRPIHYFGSAVFCKGDKFIVSYSGGERNGAGYYPTQLMVFNFEGDYLNTLNVGYKIMSFSYDKEDNRIYFSFNDEIQFGYLDLDGLV